MQVDYLPAKIPGNSLYRSSFFPKGEDGGYISGVVSQGDEGCEDTQQRPVSLLLGCWLPMNEHIYVCVCVHVSPLLQLRVLVCRDPEDPPSGSQAPVPSCSAP